MARVKTLLFPCCLALSIIGLGAESARADDFDRSNILIESEIQEPEWSQYKGEAAERGSTPDNRRGVEAYGFASPTPAPYGEPFSFGRIGYRFTRTYTPNVPNPAATTVWVDLLAYGWAAYVVDVFSVGYYTVHFAALASDPLEADGSVASSNGQVQRANVEGTTYYDGDGHVLVSATFQAETDLTAQVEARARAELDAMNGGAIEVYGFADATWDVPPPP